MDARVNCMACLVSDEEGTLEGCVTTVNGITHALARTITSAYWLCAFDSAGVIKRDWFRRSKVIETNIQTECHVKWNPD